MSKKPLNFDFSTYLDNTINIPKHDLGTTDASKGDGKFSIAEVVDKTPFDQFDLVRAQNHDNFLAIKNKLNEMREKADKLSIKTEADNNTALEMRIQVKALTKSAEETLDKYGPYNKAAEFKTSMDRFIRENFKKPLEALDKLIVPKINFFQRTQAELKRKIDAKKAEEAAKLAKAEAEKKAKEDAARQEKERQDAIDLQAKMNLEADNAGVDRVAVPIPELVMPDALPPAPEIPVTQKSEKVIADHGTAKIETVWICTIIDPLAVPMAFCSPDQDKLDSAVEAGVRDIPGCKIEESFDQKIRLSKKRHENKLVF